MLLEVKIARIKQRRSEMGLSIREAAKVTATSPSTIQKIESNEMVPSIAVLMKIAQGLKQPVTALFEDENEPEEVALIRYNQRGTISIPASKLKVEDLGSSIIDAQLEVVLLTIEKGGESGKDPLIHEGEEIKFCLEGKIAYFINDHEYHLESGDCIHFKSSRPHYWKNIHPGTTRVLSVVFNPPAPLMYGKEPNND
jgi:transcriptional regulator with XRE-family HTH domain